MPEIGKTFEPYSHVKCYLALNDYVYEKQPCDLVQQVPLSFLFKLAVCEILKTGKLVISFKLSFFTELIEILTGRNGCLYLFNLTRN